MIRGVGNDIIAVNRIKDVIERHGQRFLDRIFTLKEQEYCSRHRESARHYAGRFAAKEAIVKALGIGFVKGVTWLDIEILNNDLGKPNATFSAKLNELFDHPKLTLSISHCHEYATAVAIFFD